MMKVLRHFIIVWARIDGGTQNSQEYFPSVNKKVNGRVVCKESIQAVPKANHEIS